MAVNITQLSTYVTGTNTTQDWFFALIVFVILMTILKVFKHLLIGKFKKLAKKTKTDIDDLIFRIIDSFGGTLFFFFSLYLALKFVTIPVGITKSVNIILFVLLTVYIIKIVDITIKYFSDKFVEKKKTIEEKVDTSFIEIMNKILRVIIWVIAILFILSNLGFNVSTFLAGLGIGGIAIAIALQNVLGDIFASFSIFFDKPFQVGDFIIVGNDLGVIKKIGIKSTRLESLWGQEIIISNKELTNARINNYKKMRKRRVHFSFGVVYQTPSKKLKDVLKIVKEIFDKIEKADLDRVHFKDFGDYSLNYEVAYYVNTGDYNEYMNVQQEINFALFDRFEKAKIEFAYPTQTVFVEK